jgi:hypothetical protein
MMQARLVLCSMLLVQALPFSCDRNAPAPPSAEPAPPTAIDLTPDSLRDQVLARVEQYYVDFSARDWPRYAGHFWPQATLTTVWQPPGESEPRVVTTSVQDFIAQAPQGPGSKSIFEEQMTSAEAWASGNLAQVWAHYRASFGEPGNVQVWTGTDAFTLLRHNGQWRIVSLVYSNDAGSTSHQ